MVNWLKEFFYKVKFSQGNGGVLARGATGVFLVKVIGAGLVFILQIIFARLLGPKQYGIYVYAWTVVNILAIFSLLGFQTSLVRFIAEYNIKKQWNLFLGILQSSKQLALSFSFIIIFIGLATIYLLGKSVSFDLKVAISIALFVLPPLVLMRLQEASLRALKQVIYSNLLYEVIRPVLTIFIVFSLFFLLHKNLDASYAMIGIFIAIFLTALNGAVFLRRFLPDEVRKVQPNFANKEWLKVSLPLLLIAAMHIIFNKTDIIMLGALKGPEQTGIYSVAVNVSILISFALTAINFILAPMISELYHTNRKKELQRIIALAARAIFIFTLFMSLVLIIFGKSILGLFGKAFIIAYVPLLILLAGQIINSLSGSVGSIMSMSSQQNAMGFIIGASTVVNIILNITLIPKFSLIGAAIATAVTMAMWNIAMLVYIYKKLGINSTVFAKI